jgi:hypothetical protein
MARAGRTFKRRDVTLALGKSTSLDITAADLTVPSSVIRPPARAWNCCRLFSAAARVSWSPQSKW